MKRIRTFVAVSLAASTLAFAQASHALTTTTASYTIKVKVTSGSKLTLVVTSAGGRLLSAPTAVTGFVQSITTTKVSSMKGVSLHLVNSADATTAASKEGDYFGPVVLSWNTTTSSTATLVYRRLKASTSTTIDLGTVAVKKVGAGKQGYAIATAKQVEVDTSTSGATKASGGRPVGVGSYGKSGSTKVAALGVSADVTALATPDFAGDTTLGGDIDDDGILNAFDVNDDGDSTLDSADSSTPNAQVDPDAEATTGTCAPVDFRIFTNFKATQPGFAGTINFYGSGEFGATNERIVDRIKRSMTMVFSPVSAVCGSAVTKTELKGVGVPYAPSAYVELTKKCNTNDYQWSIGQGKMCAGSPDNYTFGVEDYGFSMTDLPSGQDTFVMRVTTASGKTFEFTSSPGFVFVTHPMLKAFCRSTSESGCTSASDFTSIDYGTTIDGPEGARVDYSMSLADNEFLFLAVFRPQRLAIDGESGTTYDLGGFRWTPDIPNAASGQGPGKCDALTTTDLATDSATNLASPSAIMLKWNIKSCYTARGATWTTGSNDFDIMVEPVGPGGNSAQKVRLTYTSS